MSVNCSAMVFHCKVRSHRGRMPRTVPESDCRKTLRTALTMTCVRTKCQVNKIITRFPKGTFNNNNLKWRARKKLASSEEQAPPNQIPRKEFNFIKKNASDRIAPSCGVISVCFSPRFWVRRVDESCRYVCLTV